MTLRAAACVILALSLLSVPAAAMALAPGAVARVAFLSSGGPDQETTLLTALRERLRERGWFENQNLALDVRYASGDYSRVDDLVAEALRSRPDLLMTRGGPMTAAARRATKTIPIVMWGVTDPVGVGLVASLPRPAGNVTGLSDDQDPAVVGKRLQLLKDVAPTISRVAIITRVNVPRVKRYEDAFEAAARTLAMQIRWWYVTGPDDIAKAFGELVREGADALDVSYTPVTWIHRRQILDLAAQHRRPAMYWHRGYVLDGGLMSYGEDEREVPRRLAEYVDRILRGTRPADLPVEQPTKLELLINLKTAQTLGLTIPQSVLLRAEQVIQ
jgi:putative tryptophan/tyrosine transport system substrate-binding protein